MRLPRNVSRRFAFTRRQPRVEFCDRCGQVRDPYRRSQELRDRAITDALRLGGRF